MKSINVLIKTIIVGTIISILNIIPSYASENFYISKATVDNNGSTIVKNSDGSWYSYNKSKKQYIFKSVDSNKELDFKDVRDLDFYMNNYKNIKYKNNPFILNNNIMNIGFDKHSNNIYVNDLESNENLKTYAEKWLKDNYNLKLEIPILYSNDVNEKENGRFSYKDGKAIDIKINSSLMGVDLLVEKSLIHELTHYALFSMNKDFNDESEKFKKECTKNGSNTNYGDVGFLQSHLKSTLW